MSKYLYLKYSISSYWVPSYLKIMRLSFIGEWPLSTLHQCFLITPEMKPFTLSVKHLDSEHTVVCEYFSNILIKQWMHWHGIYLRKIKSFICNQSGMVSIFEYARDLLMKCIAEKEYPKKCNFKNVVLGWYIFQGPAN